MAAAPFVLVDAGLSSAAAPSLEATRSALSERQTFYHKLEDFVGADYAPQLAAFREQALSQRLIERLTHLLCEAIDDLAGRAVKPSVYRVALCLPEISPAEGSDGFDHEKGRDWLRQVTLDRLEGWGWCAPQNFDTYVLGAPGAVMALAEETRRGPGPDEALLLLAVDSYACRHRLGRLSARRMLFSKQSQWGFVPGEAGAAMVLRAGGEAGGLQLFGPAIEEEPDGELDGRDSLSAAMSACLQASAAHLETPAARIWNDCNNARYRASEFAYALHRLPPGALLEACELVQTADVFGEIGAASLPAAVCLAHLDAAVSHQISVVGARENKLRASLAMARR